LSVANYKIRLNVVTLLRGDTIPVMRDFLILFVYVIVTVARLARPGGTRSVVVESVLLRHQLLVLNRGRKRAPNLGAADRMIVGLCTLFMRPARVLRSAIALKPSTLLRLHDVLRKRKYHRLFSSVRRRRPGPKGPQKDLIEAVLAMKRHNPNWGCPRIAQSVFEKGSCGYNPIEDEADCSNVDHGL
jgi:putative transposase